MARLTPNQQAFADLYERAERWLKYAEKHDIPLDEEKVNNLLETLEEKPALITKDYLSDLKSQIGTSRKGFYSKYEPQNADENDEVDIWQKAFNYVENLVGELRDCDEATQELCDVLIDVLYTFINSYAGEEEAEIFCTNYDTQKASIESGILAVRYGSPRKNSNELFINAEQVLEWLFNGIDFDYHEWDDQISFHSSPQGYTYRGYTK